MTLYLGQLDIGACRGCRACFDRGEDKCPLKDNLLATVGSTPTSHTLGTLRLALSA